MDSSAQQKNGVSEVTKFTFDGSQKVVPFTFHLLLWTITVAELIGELFRIPYLRLLKPIPIVLLIYFIYKKEV